MSAYDDLVGLVRGKLADAGYTLTRTQVAMGGQRVPVEVTFPSPVFRIPLIAIPDVHMADGTGADIFANGSRTANAKRLFDFMRVAAYDVLQTGYQGNLELVQLGDWFDVWRAYPADLDTATYDRIESVYPEIAAIDADIGLKHLIGNHDAAFARALSGYRSAQPELFPFGSWLAGGKSVFSLHGHQVDAMRFQDAPDGPAASKVIAFVSAVTRSAGDPSLWRAVQDAYDKEGWWAALGTWLEGALFGVRPDPDHVTTADPADPPSQGTFLPSARFAANGSGKDLVDIAFQIRAADPVAAGTPLRALVVGHSHLPRVSWTAHQLLANPVVVIDVGSWTYGAANVLLAAGEGAGVFDVGFA